jgi:hypothetical protein
MKKLLLFSAIVLCAVALRAQPGTISLNLDAGYNFASTVNLDGGTIKPQGALQYGGGLEFFPNWDQSIEIKYLRSDPTVNVNYFVSSVGKNYSTTGSQNYILLGWNKYFGMNPEAKAIPYGGLGLGMNILGNGNSTATKFCWDAKLGVKIKTKSAVSLKLQAYLEHSLSAVGTDIWYGWYGAYPVTTYAALWQFGLGGVLCFDFKKK